MRKTREILRLKWLLDRSHRAIAWSHSRRGCPRGSASRSRGCGRRAPWPARSSAWSRSSAPRTDVVLPGRENATFLGGLIGAHEAATGPFAGRATTRAGHMSFALGSGIPAASATRLYAQRDALRLATAQVLEATPVLALPTTAIPPPAITRARCR